MYLPLAIRSPSLAANQPDPGVQAGQALDEDVGPVLGRIVDDDVLPVGVRLPLDARHGLLEVGGAVANRSQDADAR
jgi:hypothetical protein